ncbi:deoxyribonuclease IV [Nicoliella lavandulae]|uniref:Probable endonuclease 4 n=1 Tax=Nicoliella lavandulae TaxID=3082954 RepID=A0ABU8SML3_9LACO
MSDKFLIGSHVSMKSPKMFLGSAEEAYSYGENTFMIYTGAPQNTKRKPLSELRIDDGKQYMQAHGIVSAVVHAPYIINLGNSDKPQNFNFAIQFLKQEIDRSEALGVHQIVLHPGSHVGAGAAAGINQIIKGLNEVIDPKQDVQIALETMAGKGTEIGRTFEELAQIIDGVQQNQKLSVTFDTCHTNDAGYDVKNDFDGVMNHFDHVIGLERLKVVHLNDSKNEMNSHKDRHEIIGLGTIGFDALNYIAHYPQLVDVPKIMETPAVKTDDGKKLSPHGYEVEMLKTQKFDPNLMDDILNQRPY